MHEDAAFETIPVRAAFQQLQHGPLQVLHRDFRILVDLPPADERGIRRRYDHRIIIQGGNRPHARFDVSGEELIEGLPPAWIGHVFVHVEAWAVVERLKRFFCERFGRIEKRPPRVSILHHPRRQWRQRRCLVFRRDLVLKTFDRLLIEDEVELADAVIDLPPWFCFGWNPFQKRVDGRQVVIKVLDIFDARHVVSLRVLDGLLKHRLPAVFLDQVFQLHNNRLHLGRARHRLRLLRHRARPINRQYTHARFLAARGTFAPEEGPFLALAAIRKEAVAGLPAGFVANLQLAALSRSTLDAGLGMSAPGFLSPGAHSPRK